MTYEQLHLWMMAFIRSGGLLALSPVFLGKMIPVPLRVALAAFLAYVVSGNVHGPVPLPGDVVTLVLSAAHELMIGLMMGLGMRLVFYSIEMAGQIISTEIGLVMSAQIDPISQNNSTSIGTALF